MVNEYKLNVIAQHRQHFIKRMNILTGESTDKIASYVFDLKMYKESVRKNE
jgi:hypothetical protein